MPRVRRKSLARRDEFSLGDQMCMDIQMIAGTNWGKEFSRDELEAGWEWWREDELPEWISKHPGTRPHGFYEYEIGEHHGENELQFLLDRDLLLPDEKAELLRRGDLIEKPD